MLFASTETDFHRLSKVLEGWWAAHRTDGKPARKDSYRSWHLSGGLGGGGRESAPRGMHSGLPFCIPWLVIPVQGERAGCPRRDPMPPRVVPHLRWGGAGTLSDSILELHGLVLCPECFRKRWHGHCTLCLQPLTYARPCGCWRRDNKTCWKERCPDLEHSPGPHPVLPKGQV